MTSNSSINYNKKKYIYIFFFFLLSTDKVMYGKYNRHHEKKKSKNKPREVYFLNFS